MTRVGCAILVLAALGLAACKKSEAPAATEAPKSQAAPASEAPAPGAPLASAAPVQAEPAPTPTVGSTKESEAAKKDEKSKSALTAEPTTLAEAEKALDQAVVDLNQLAGAKGGRGAGAGASALAAGDARCPEACKAMDSLRRAAAAVCRLAGDANGRCARAKNIVKDSESRVAVCKCEPAKD